MLGGISGSHRELITEGAYGVFEHDMDRLMGDRMRSDDSFCVRVWGTLANMTWRNALISEDVGYSFRAAGDLIAAIRREGDYMTWYCSHTPASHDDEIEGLMGRAGWKVEAD